MELLDSFHFARPWALTLLPVILVQVAWYLHFRHTSNPWQGKMRQDLQQRLLVRPEKQPRYMLWTVTAVCLTSIALAGPSWSQQSRPALLKQDNLIVILDLSLSMLAEDLPPNRITRSKQKLQDLLKQRTEGMTALVVYSGDAHTVTPLTQDTGTIRNLLPALDPLMMPKLGSAAEDGVRQAIELVRQSGFQKARLLLITDGLDDAAQQGIEKLLPDSMNLSIMSVGTEAGAPIPLDDQGFVKDQKGNVIISTLDQASLENFATTTNSLIHPITLDEEDLRYLLPNETDLQHIKETQTQLPLWIEQGHWFLLPVLPLAALAFRRNWLLMLPLLIFLSQVRPVYAFWPSDPPPPADSQVKGEQAFGSGNFSEAAQLLQDPLWKGSAYYRQQEYEKAVREFAKSDTPQAHYNRANALAKQGRLDEAISAYSKALEQDPTLKDAEYNRSLVEALRNQQQTRHTPPDSQHPETPQGNTSKSAAKQSGTQKNNAGDQPQSGDKKQPGDQASSDTPASSPSASAPDNPEQGRSVQRRGEDFGPDDDRSMFGKPNSHESDDKALDQNVRDKLAEQQRKQQQNTSETGTATSAAGDSMSEEALSLEQWLRRIPDDPAGLLRRKFEFEANQHREPLPEGRAPW